MQPQHPPAGSAQSGLATGAPTGRLASLAEMPGRRMTQSSMPAGELEAAARFRTELRRFLRATESVTSREGLTPERYDLLLMIHAARVGGETVTVTTLRDALQLPQQGVTELVKRAVQAGLVDRTQSAEDGRVYHLALTAEAELRLMRVFQALRDDRTAFAEAFERLHLSFRALTPGQRPARRGRGRSTDG